MTCSFVCPSHPPPPPPSLLLMIADVGKRHNRSHNSCLFLSSSILLLLLLLVVVAVAEDKRLFHRRPCEILVLYEPMRCRPKTVPVVEIEHIWMSPAFKELFLELIFLFLFHSKWTSMHRRLNPLHNNPPDWNCWDKKRESVNHLLSPPSAVLFPQLYFTPDQTWPVFPRRLVQ